MVSHAPILFGCSGYSYPEWVGTFYPDSMPRAQLLEYYAARFTVLELDHTCYRMPVQSSMARLVERTGGGLVFTVRLHRSMTHDRPGDGAVIRQFVEGLEPLCSAGVLGAVLAEFPRSFEPTRESARYVNWMHKQLNGIPLAVEFRNGGWSRPEVFEWLRRRQVAFCCVDQPRLPGLFPATVMATAQVGYLRFHGRNAEAWFRTDDPGDRYAYRYQEAELRPWVGKVRELRRQCQTVLCVFNNRRDGSAPVNATEMEALVRLSDEA